MKISFITSLFPLGAIFYASAQTETVEPDSSEIITVREQTPEYPGGVAALVKYLGSEMTYPLSARKQGIEGSVFVSFFVEKNGDVTEVTVVKGISEECDAEAARVVQQSGPWIPGRINELLNG